MAIEFLHASLKFIPKALINSYRYVKQKWFPSKYGYQLANSNILEVIGPYTNRLKVIEFLGQPHEIQGSSAAYRFSNALLQINYDGDSVESLVLVSLKLNWPHRFKIFPFDFTIGASTFEDVCSSGCDKQKIELKRNSSSKFSCLWNEQYFGHPGRYFYFSFALLSAATFPQIMMPESKYEPVDESDFEGRYLLLTANTKFNAVSISTQSEDCFLFNFTLFN